MYAGYLFSLEFSYIFIWDDVKQKDVIQYL